MTRARPPGVVRPRTVECGPAYPRAVLHQDAEAVGDQGVGGALVVAEHLRAADLRAVVGADHDDLEP